MKAPVRPTPIPTYPVRHYDIQWNMDQFDKVTAAFTPRRTDDLKPGAQEWIGRVTQWQAVWRIEGGPYADEWAMVPVGDDRSDAPFAWVPRGDLTR